MRNSPFIAIGLYVLSMGVVYGQSGPLACVGLLILIVVIMLAAWNTK